MKSYNDKELIMFYRQWSEEFYCAGFMHPDKDTVQEFYNWLQRPDYLEEEDIGPYADYELEMIKVFREIEVE